MFLGGRKGKKGIRHSSRGGHIYPLSSPVKPRELSFSCLCTAAAAFASTRFIFYLSYFITKTKVLFFFFFLMLFLYQDFCPSLILLLTFLCLASSVHCVKQFRFMQKFQPILLFLFFFPVYKKKERLLKFSQQPNRVQYLQSARVLVNFLFL